MEGAERERVAVNANIDWLIDRIAEIPPNESDREVRWMKNFPSRNQFRARRRNHSAVECVSLKLRRVRNQWLPFKVNFSVWRRTWSAQSHPNFLLIRQVHSLNVFLKKCWKAALNVGLGKMFQNFIIPDHWNFCCLSSRLKSSWPVKSHSLATLEFWWHFLEMNFIRTANLGRIWRNEWESVSWWAGVTLVVHRFLEQQNQRRATHSPGHRRPRCGKMRKFSPKLERPSSSGHSTWSARRITNISAVKAK